MPVLHGGLFRGKLRAPEPSHIVVPRERLHHLIDDAVERGSLIVSAAAGSGKTQLLTGWVTRQRTPRAVAWLALDEGDRDPLRFLRYVVAAMETTGPGLEAMRGVSLPAAATAVNEALLLGVAEAMSRLTDDVVLVLDDFDCVTGSETEQLLARVLRFPPERVRLVVLSRAEPRLGQSRLALLGYVTELDETDLAFTSDELVQLTEAHGIRLGAEELDALQTRTAGWAAGVALWMTGLQQEAASTGPTHADAGEALAVDYLMTEVLAAQPDALQEFLLRATASNPVCGELADALTGSVDGSRTLAALHEAHLFITHVDDLTDQGQTWYRWHPLFAAAVQQQLVATDPQLATSLHRTASRWHRRHGSPAEAVRHAVAGGDQQWAAELLGECWIDLVVAGELARTHQLLHLFDEHTRSTQPELAVICALLRVQKGDLDRACRCAETAVMLSRRLPARRQLAVEVMATVIRLHAAELTGIDRVAGLHDTGIALLDRIRRTRGYLHSRDRVRLALLLYQLGAYENSRWMVGEARTHLTEALAEAESTDLPDLVVRCTAQLALTGLVAGRFDAARTLAQGVAASPQRLGSPRILAIAHTVLGGVDLAGGEVASALQHLSQAGQDVQPNDVVSRFLLGAATHFALHAAGRVAPARAELGRIESLVAREPLPEWIGTVLMVLRAEQLVAEERWLDALAVLEPADEPAGDAAGTVRRCWRGEVLRLSGRLEEAAVVLADLEEDASPAFIIPMALASQAVVNEALERHDAALESLDRALGAAVAEQAFYPFLRLGSRVRLLIEQLVDTGTPHEAFAIAVLDRLSPEHRHSVMSSVSFEPLTAREREVLRALQGTASNEEIAQRLFVSMNTLRTHLKHINRKLGTASRREAVARARELSLL